MIQKFQCSELFPREPLLLYFVHERTYIHSGIMFIFLIFSSASAFSNLVGGIILSLIFGVPKPSLPKDAVWDINPSADGAFNVGLSPKRDQNETKNCRLGYCLFYFKLLESNINTTNVKF